MKLDQADLEILEKAGKKTMTNYWENVKWFNPKELDGYIDGDELIGIIEDLICEIDHLEEKAEDREQEIQDNYRRITPAEMYEG